MVIVSMTQAIRLGFESQLHHWSNYVTSWVTLNKLLNSQYFSFLVSEMRLTMMKPISQT